MIPLTFAQRRLWYLNQLGEGVTYHVPFAARLRGPLDVFALRAAVGDVIDRHGALRTIFPSHDGEPYQKILRPGELPPWLRLVECTEDVLDRAITKANRQPIDITAERPVRVWLFVLGPAEYVLLVVVHLIAGDSWSTGPILRDLSTAYAARTAGQAPSFAAVPTSHLEHAERQRKLLGRVEDPGSLQAAQLRYWKRTLAGLPAELCLPADRPRGAEPSHRGDVVRFTVAPLVHARLTELAATTRSTLFMVLQAALAVLLCRMGAGTEIPIGSMVPGRSHRALDKLVGFLANTLVLRTDLAGDPTFRELLVRVRDCDLAAYAHQDVPFGRVVEAVEGFPTLSRHPLFQVMLVVQDNLAAELTLPGLEVDPQPIVTGSAGFDLLAGFEELRDSSGRPAGIAGLLEYEIALFDRDTVNALATRLVRVLEQAGAAPDRPIGTIELLDEAERHTLLVDWNDATMSGPDGRCLHELFEEQVERTPDAVALIFDGSDVSYADLNAKANQLARYLVRQGIRPGELVGIYLDRSPILVAALLAVLKLGSGYVLLDPKQSARMLHAVLADAGLTTVITIGGRSARLAAADVGLIRLDAQMVGRIAHELDDNLAGTVRPDDVACVQFAADRAGRPHGVVSSHRALTGSLLGQRHLALGPAEVFLQCSPLSSAGCLLELFGPLLFGGTAVLQQGQQPEPALMAELVSRHEVTVLHLAPSLFGYLLDEHPAIFRVVRQVITGGEPVPVNQVRRALRLFPALRVVHGYGPAECAGLTTTFPIAEPDVTEATSVPIGRLVANKRAYVLDAALRPVPIGAVGELYLGGPCLANGYLRRPALTAARFVADPFGPPGERMYRTGDLARWRPNGQLDLVGPVDGQVLVRGLRVAPEVVETALTSHPAVARAAVVPVGGQLVGYVVAVDGHGVRTGALREHVSRLLPEHMVPSALVVLDTLPLTAGGRLDTAALPAAGAAALPMRRPPRTPRERTMCELFCDVLGVPEVGIDDSFLEFGGHSLLANRLVSRIRTAFGAELNIRTVFESPTVAALVERLPDAGLP
ncbi:MAG: non-ribosomal peptide synthetase [Labedaea sp.]